MSATRPSETRTDPSSTVFHMLLAWFAGRHQRTSLATSKPEWKPDKYTESAFASSAYKVGLFKSVATYYCVCDVGIRAEHFMQLCVRVKSVQNCKSLLIWTGGVNSSLVGVNVSSTPSD